MSRQIPELLRKIQKLQARLNVNSFKVVVFGDMIFCNVGVNGTEEFFHFADGYDKERNQYEYKRLQQLIDNV